MYIIDCKFIFAVHKNSPNPWREVIVQQEGYATNPTVFPLLYDARVIDLGKKSNFAMTSDSELNVKLKELNESTKYLVMISEYLEEYTTMDNYFVLYPEKIENMIAKMIQIVGVMRNIKLFHLDMHLFNFMTDGINVKIIDFGTSIIIPYTKLRFDEKYALSKVKCRDFGNLIFNSMTRVITVFSNDIKYDYCYYIIKNMEEFKFMTKFLKYKQICMLMFDYYENYNEFQDEKMMIEWGKILINDFF